MPRRRLALLFWFAWLVWCGGILWLSSLSHRDLPAAAFLAWDKFNHFAAFAIGGWLAATAWQIGRPAASTLGRLTLPIVMVAAFGALDELVQLYTPGRTGADLHDWIADFLGAIAGALFSLSTHARLERLVTRR